jgi:hypothetical protein
MLASRAASDFKSFAGNECCPPQEPEHHSCPATDDCTMPRCRQGQRWYQGGGPASEPSIDSGRGIRPCLRPKPISTFSKLDRKPAECATMRPPLAVLIVFSTANARIEDEGISSSRRTVTGISACTYGQRVLSLLYTGWNVILILLMCSYGSYQVPHGSWDYEAGSPTERVIRGAHPLIESKPPSY